MENEVKDTEEAVVEEPKKRELKTCEDWEEFLTTLANPKCTNKLCYGRGYIGWQETPNGKMPIICGGKGCSLAKLKAYQRQQRIEEMKAKQNKKVEKEVENVSTDN